MEDDHMDDDHMDTDKPLDLLLCSQLINTYNTTILGKMDLHMQEALRDEAEKKAAICATTNKQNEKERIVLKELIKSHYDPNLQNERENLLPAYIGGPFNLTCHWSEYYQKLIYIFGEEHSNNTDCERFKSRKGTPIEEYLQKLIKISDCFLDLLIEFEAYKGYQYINPLSELEDADFRLVKIASTFSSCINASERDTEKNKPKCSRSRIHYFDVRSIEKDPKQKGPDPVSLFIFEYVNIKKRYKTVDGTFTREQAYHLSYELIQMTKKYPGVMNGFLLEKNLEENSSYLQFWYSMLLKNSYTKKELDHLKDNYNIRTKIESFIKSQMLLELDTNVSIYEDQCSPSCKVINNSAKLILDNSKLINRNSLKDIELIDNFETLIIMIILVNASVIDAYVLARIFKKFNLEPIKIENRRSTDEPDEARNIIIYAGNMHCTTYRKFLQANGFELLADIGEAELENKELQNGKPRNCVDMTIKNTKMWSMQPLFSKWPPEKDPNLDTKKKEVKKSWGCNVMFRSKKTSVKLTENIFEAQEYIMNAFGVNRSPNDYYDENEKSSNSKIVKIKKTSPSPSPKKEHNRIKKTTGSI